MNRRFEKVSFKTFQKAFPNIPTDLVKKIYNNVKLPTRKTQYSAGYDFITPIDFILEPNDSLVIPTGIKAYMQPNEFLGMYIRSSFGIKKNIILKNGVGIIDADYVDNESNEGHIMVAIRNMGNEILSVSQGDAISQGIFQMYLTVDDDKTTETRIGGIGSTNKEIRIEKATIEDAKELLKIQKESFKIYKTKYGHFDTNPYNMTLQRMEFNLKYRLGDYKKILLNDKIIGGIFGFMLEEETTWHIAQFYILPEYEHLGYGTIAFEKFFEEHKDVLIWYADTIKQEKQNVEFYQKFGFQIIDEEEEHVGMSFVTMIKK